MMKLIVLTGVLFVCCIRGADSVEVGSVKIATDAQLTADGCWFIYLMMPLEEKDMTPFGEVTVVLRSTRDETERRYSAGEASRGAGNLKVSDSGRWVGFIATANQPHTSEDTLTKFTLVNSNSGRLREVANTRNFSFVKREDFEWVILEGQPTEKRKSFDLTLQRLDTKESSTWTASSYALDPTHRRIVWVGPEGVKVHDLVSGSTSTLDMPNADSISNITWSPLGNALAALRRDNQEMELLVFDNFSSATIRKRIFSSNNLAGFPDQYEISNHDLRVQNYPNYETRKVITWRADEGGIFIGIRPKEEVREQHSKVISNLAIWHWQDDHTPAAKEWARNEAQRFSYLNYISLTEGRFIQLADKALRNVLPHANSQLLLGYDTRSYDRAEAGGARETRDYYLVDLRTGKRIRLADGLRIGIHNAPRLSPTGKFVLYQKDGDYYSYEVRSGVRRNMTGGLPTQFYYEENLRNTRVVRISEGWLNISVWQGWSVDGSYVLCSDYRDVWALPLGDGEAINLTGNGHREDIVYTRTQFQGSIRESSLLADEGVDVNAPMYFSVKERRTGRTGLAQRVPSSKKLKMLRVENAAIEYRKAAKAETYFISRNTSREPVVYSVADENWRAGRRLLATADLDRRPLTPGLYLSYSTARGDTWHATLIPPLNYEPGRSYPTIVRIYEGGLAAPHAFLRPGDDLLTAFHEQGYALLFPDIQPRVNEAGYAAVECVTAAVEAAVATGIVDKDRLGLTGHSMGGYETLFIISQTHLFRAAIAQSGFANLWSKYGHVWPNGIPKRIGMESGQPYLAGPWWEHWHAYIRNSPLYHARSIKTPLLIVHGSQDSGVPFSNILELFVALHRMADKPVVLLEYKGEDHTSIHVGNTGNDVHTRMQQFFDHFLKNSSAPDWWTDGVSIPTGEVPAVSLISVE